MGTAFARNGSYGAIGRLLVLFPDEFTYAKYLSDYINLHISIFFENSGIPQLTGVSFAKYKVALPPTLTEQRAIATALSDMDALIVVQEQLIAKKRSIKQGAMQELLTGKRRLISTANKGYKQTEVGLIPEDWKIFSLGSISKKIASGKSSTYSESGDFLIYGSTGIIGYKKYYDYFGKKILVARVGANAGKVYVVDGQYCISDNTLFIDLNHSVCLYLIKYNLIFMEINRMIYGSGQPLITGGQLKNLKIPLPPTLTEQLSIATALGDIDAEIDQIEVQLAKYREVKKGLMQELLMGKKRLV